MINWIESLASFARQQDDITLVIVSGAALVGAGLVALHLIRFSSFLLHALKHRPEPRDWSIRPATDENGLITIWSKMASQLELYDSQTVELRTADGQRKITGTLNCRNKRSNLLAETGLILSRDLYEQLSGRGETGDSEPTENDVLDIRANLVGIETPFWNHPDRTKRYNNRITVWITLWTTMLTTMLAVAIEVFL